MKIFLKLRFTLMVTTDIEDKLKTLVYEIFIFNNEQIFPFPTSIYLSIYLSQTYKQSKLPTSNITFTYQSFMILMFEIS